MTKHDCPANGCDKEVPFEVLACKAHWFALPVPLRKRISQSWARQDLLEWAAARAEAVTLLGGVVD